MKSSDAAMPPADVTAMALIRPFHEMTKSQKRRHVLMLSQTIPSKTARNRCLRKHSRHDSQLFARAFFTHLCPLDFSPMHKAMMEEHDQAVAADVSTRAGSSIAIAAPRGAAKSTIMTLILPIHAICYKRESYILIISATLKQARQRLRNIQRELRVNEKLISAFGAFDEPDAPWNAQSLQTHGIQIDVFSAGTEMRGVSLGAHRPTLIILDDVENSRSVESAEQREKMRRWFSEVVENLGSRSTRLIIVGTLLHPDSLLRGLLRRPDFTARSYASILQWSEAGEFWDEWRSLYTNLADPRRRSNARQYFEARRAEMLAGTKVLWEAREDYYALMEKLTTQGRRAFFQEKQNDPLTESDGLFRLERFAWFEIENDAARPAAPPDFAISLNTQEPPQPTRDFAPAPLGGMTIFGFLDPAMGAKNNRGDFAAIAVIGRDKTGALYILDVWRERAAPTNQVRRAYELHEQWRFEEFGVEANLFQELLTLPFAQDAGRRPGTAKLKLRLIKQRANKERRLLGLENYIANGWLRFSRGLDRDVLMEFADFPRSGHDDAMDAIEGAVNLAREVRTTAIHTTSPRPTSRATRGF